LSAHPFHAGQFHAGEVVQKDRLHQTVARLGELILRIDDFTVVGRAGLEAVAGQTVLVLREAQALLRHHDLRVARLSVLRGEPQLGADLLFELRSCNSCARWRERASRLSALARIPSKIGRLMVAAAAQAVFWAPSLNSIEA